MVSIKRLFHVTGLYTNISFASVWLFSSSHRMLVNIGIRIHVSNIYFIFSCVSFNHRSDFWSTFMLSMGSSLARTLKTSIHWWPKLTFWAVLYKHLVHIGTVIDTYPYIRRFVYTWRQSMSGIIDIVIGYENLLCTVCKFAILSYRHNLVSEFLGCEVFRNVAWRPLLMLLAWYPVFLV